LFVLERNAADSVAQHLVAFPRQALVGPTGSLMDDNTDIAMTRRLAKLRAIPVDTSRLERFIRSQIPELTSGGMRRLHWLRSSRAVAAGLLLTGLLVTAFISSSSGPAVASPVALAEIHDEVVSGHARLTPVKSIAAASVMIEEQWRSSPGLPYMAQGEPMSCCVHLMGRKKMAIVSFLSNGIPVTLAVADASEVRTSASVTVKRDRSVFHVQSSDNVNMVMFRHSGRWICLMGALPNERLIDLAEKLR